MENENFLQHIHFLAVEGVIGAGKTSFCNLLAARTNAKLILEESEENPFLREFYSDRRALAFKAQLWFLLSRYSQLSRIPQKNLFHHSYISDYVFEKDRIFAHLNLDDQELQVYDKVAKAFERDIPSPDFVIYLQVSTDRLIKNIRHRDRPYERELDVAYIERLNDSYNQFFFAYTQAPVLIVDASAIDFVRNPGDMEEVLRELNKGGKGTRFFRPLAGPRS